MNWAALYLGCFVVGLLLTLVSLLAGSVHVHMPHFHFGHGAGLHGSGHGPGHGVGPRIGVKAAGTHGAHTQVPVINFATVVAFLAWFGATGYLLTHFHPLQIAVGLLFAVVGGLAGASIVFWFLAKLVAHDNTMQSSDYDMIGVLGKVNISIRPGGTGEIIFSLAGTRRCCGARSESDTPIAKGEEVVVTRYERGIAYVKRWEELAGSDALPETEEQNSAGAG
jgi:membrane protein implicated in regulation of membrane protease activity